MYTEVKNLIASLKEEEIELVLNKDENIEIISFQKKIPQDLLVKLKSNKEDIIVYLKSLENTKKQLISPSEKLENYPLSSAQKRLWLTCQVEGVSQVYNMPSTNVLEGEYDLDYLFESIESTIERHEILRTVFREDSKGEVRQWILEKDELNFNIDYFDYRNMEQGQSMFEEYVKKDRITPFDLEKGPLLRVCLFHLVENKYVLYANIHHIISDGWSQNILVRDVLEYYQSFINNIKPSLTELKIQYKDYACWEFENLSLNKFEKERKYWIDKLSNDIPYLQLPNKKIRPRTKTYNGYSLQTLIPAKVTSLLKEVTKEERCSIFIGVLTSLNILFYKYTLEKDIIIGTPIAERDNHELIDQIGFYLNTLVNRNIIDEKESFRVFLEKVRDNVLEAYEYQSYPFDAILEDLELNYDLSGNPLFNVLLDFHNTNKEIETFQFNEKEVSNIRGSGEQTVKYDLEFHFEEKGDYLSLNLKFNSDIYEKEAMIDLIANYKVLLNNLLNTPERKIEEIDFSTYNSHQANTIKDKVVIPSCSENLTVIQLLEEQVLRNPEKVALSSRQQDINYQELKNIVDQLAVFLKDSYNIERGALVGVLIDNSIWSVLSILGILKAGGIYVPIDINYPLERKEYMVEDANLDLMITVSEYMFDIDFYDGAIMAIDIEFDYDITKEIQLENEDLYKELAYVIYTSGSTGKPKGVMIEHNSLSNYLIWARDYYLLNSELKNYNFGLFTSLSFDLTITSLFLPIISGGTLYISSFKDVSENLKWYFEKPISCIKLTPAHIIVLNELEIDFSALELVIVGGEELLPVHVTTLQEKKPKIKIFNEYGPTESTVGCTVFEVISKEKINIGKPIRNTDIFILSENLQQQIKGAIGEICVGGSGIARGYLNREELTSQKFIDNPFSNNSKLYRTGDLGYFLEDDNIQFIGRKDNQQKLNGYRIELGEIESIINQYLGINSAAVVINDIRSNEKNLEAYLVTNKAISTSKLRSYLEEFLPNYMIPNKFFDLERLPLTLNGKVDKSKLLNFDYDQIVDENMFVEPQTEEEYKLVKIWKEILQIDEIGIIDDFFSLGGNSLKAMKIIINSKKEGLEYKVKDIFKYRTIRDISTYIKNNSKITILDKKFTSVEDFKKIDTEHKVLISENQKLALKNHNAHGVFGPYSIPKQNGEILENRFRSFISNYPSLCTRFYKSNNQIYQELVDRDDVKILFKQIEEDQLQNTSLFLYPFDFFSGELIRVFIVDLDNQKENIGVVIDVSHAITDMYSNQILRKDIEDFFLHNRKPKINHIHNFNYSRWQADFLNSPKGNLSREFWKNKLKEEFSSHEEKFKSNNIEKNSYDVVYQQVVLKKEEVEDLKKYAADSNHSIFTLFIGFHHYLLSLLPSNSLKFQNILTTSRDAYLEYFEGDKFIGVMNSLIPMSFRSHNDEDFDLFLNKLYQNYIELYPHQIIPYEMIVEDFFIESGIKIDEYDASVINFQLREDEILKSSNYHKISYEKSDSKANLHMKCIVYKDEILIDIRTNKEMFNDKIDLRNSLNIIKLKGESVTS
ncbi:amino acid adenylation domain-containing protein [Aquimarina rhabdastrellae]